MFLAQSNCNETGKFEGGIVIELMWCN